MIVSLTRLEQIIIIVNIFFNLKYPKFTLVKEIFSFFLMRKIMKGKKKKTKKKN